MSSVCTMAQLCQRWGWSDDTIRRLIQTGKLKHLPRTGSRGSYRFVLAEIERFERRGVKAIRSRSPLPRDIPDGLGLYGHDQ